MARGAAARRLDFEVQTMPVERPVRRDLALTPKPADLHGSQTFAQGPQKYAELELKRRRAQIRARRSLGLV